MSRYFGWVKSIVIAFGLLTIHDGITSMAQENGGLAAAVIDVEKTDIGVQLVARIVAIKSGHYTGQFTISSKGPSGTTSTSQSGKLKLEAGDSGDIATVGMSFQSGQTINAQFTLSNDKGEVATATLSIADSN